MEMHLYDGHASSGHAWQGSRPSFESLARLAAGIVSGTRYLHANGIVAQLAPHRILVNAGCVAKIHVDVRFARIASPRSYDLWRVPNALWLSGDLCLLARTLAHHRRQGRHSGSPALRLLLW